ncbi:MAG: hypothetical protein Q4G27_00845 [Flavobacteriaceae bacterium]|nr:hypothetical protein [Flavobacteriaceae bacterium]
MLYDYSVMQLKKFEALLYQINQIEFTSTMENVYHSSIGMHSRHIIEFYEMFCSGYDVGVINYEKRNRNSAYETDVNLAINRIKFLQEELFKCRPDKDLKLIIELDETKIEMPTTSRRELLYLMEHTTHHIALIRMGLQNINAAKNTFEKLGMAYSTPSK